MLMISQRRRHSRWRMLLAVIVLSDLVRHCEPISTKRFGDSSSSASSSSTLSRSSPETRSQNLGSPSDLAWQAWLLLDSQNGAHSSLDSATFLRRITPKSVFIAPELPALPPCADGYRADTMGRCIKDVSIDQQAHFDFLLQQLNNRYGNRGGGLEFRTAENNQKKKSSGPSKVDIPFLSSVNVDSPQMDRDNSKILIRFPITVPPQQRADTNVNEQSVETAETIETIATTYETSTTPEPTTTDMTTTETTSETSTTEPTTYDYETSTYETTIYDTSTYETTVYDTTGYENSTEKEEAFTESSNSTTIQNDV